jgi:hypothetical protein
MKYGFISAGGGSWYTQTLNMLEPGSRVWVNVPRVGYVGVGTVEEPAKEIKNFRVTLSGGKEVSLLEAPLRSPGIGKHADDPGLTEYVFRVNWTKAVPLGQAVSERGFFGNQNTVARPTTAKWNYTIQVLKERFGIT